MHTPASLKATHARQYAPFPCRVSYDALYSVRLTSPEDNNGYDAGLYPVTVKGGTMYQLSAYLYAAESGMTAQFTATGPLAPKGESLTSLSSTVNAQPHLSPHSLQGP